MIINANKILPKLHNNTRYYKRALYLYLCNFHVHNRNFSFMFNALEGQYKKGSNSVSSYLYFVINFIQYNCNIDSIKKICLFSDAAGGQNRNWTMIRFAVFLSIYLEIEIMHIFPVHGHSYSICDTNFATIGREFKKLPVIEVPQDYLGIIDKKKKFKSVNTDVLDFESCRKDFVNRKLIVISNKILKILLFCLFFK